MIKAPNQRGVVRRTMSFSADRVAERTARSGRRFAGELADATATKERRRRGVPATECGRCDLGEVGFCRDWRAVACAPLALQFIRFY